MNPEDPMATSNDAKVGGNGTPGHGGFGDLVGEVGPHDPAAPRDIPALLDSLPDVNPAPPVPALLDSLPDVNSAPPVGLVAPLVAPTVPAEVLPAGSIAPTAQVLPLAVPPPQYCTVVVKVEQQQIVM